MYSNEIFFFLKIIDISKSNKYLNIDLFPSLCITRKNALSQEIKQTSPSFKLLRRPLRPLAASRSLPGSGEIPIEVNERLSHPRGVFRIMPRHQSTLSRRLLSMKYVRRG